MVRSWAAPPTWVTGTRHPGRGKYLIKSGERIGLPVALSLVETERRLYDTDQAWRSPSPARHGQARHGAAGGCAVTGPSRAPLRLTEIAAPLVLLGILGGGTVVMTVVRWVAASLSAARTVPDWGGATVAGAGRGDPAGSLDPLIGAHGSRGLFWTAVGVQAAPVLAVVVAVTWWCRRPRPVRRPRRGRWPAAATCATWSGGARSAGRCSCGPHCSRPPRVAGPRGRAAARGWTRATWGCGWVGSAATTCTPAEEDVLLEIAGPRSNKTSALVVPAVLSALGPVVTTSNKVDVYTLTVGLRAQLGRVFVLDPQRICGAEQTWWWNPLAGITRHGRRPVPGHALLPDRRRRPRAGRPVLHQGRRTADRAAVRRRRAQRRHPARRPGLAGHPQRQHRSGCCAGPGCPRSPAACRAPSRPRPTSAAASTRPRSPRSAAWSPRRSCATSPHPTPG